MSTCTYGHIRVHIWLLPILRVCPKMQGIYSHVRIYNSGQFYVCPKMQCSAPRDSKSATRCLGLSCKSGPNMQFPCSPTYSGPTYSPTYSGPTYSIPTYSGPGSRSIVQRNIFMNSSSATKEHSLLGVSSSSPPVNLLC
jgi:hypothetical protein